MLKLTDYEKRMLDGRYGEFKQNALEKIVAYAKALGAIELCQVTKATLFFGAHPYLDAVKSSDYNEVFSKMYLCTDKVIPIDSFAQTCFCQTDSAPCDQYCFKPLHVPRDRFIKNSRYLEATRDAGVSIAGSCTPYFTGWLPLRGEHFVTTESSNALMCNSVFGACGNADGIEATAWSAISGRTPKWGMHTSDGRRGNTLVNIERRIETAQDWELLGYTVGRLLPPSGVPVLTGSFAAPDIISLKQCFAAMATTSGAELCHIAGFTPEASTIDAALYGAPPEFELNITDAQLRASYESICDRGSGTVDFVSLGCPHYSLEEVRSTASYLDGKRINAGVELFVWTDYSTKIMADVNGYTKMIENAGGRLMTSGCPLVIGKDCFSHASGMAFDSAKQAHYMHSETKAKIYYGNMKRLIDVAVAGRWIHRPYEER